MTQPSRTTESISRDNTGIREIMHQVRELTVPDRATLAVGLIGHLATLMNRSQMAKLLEELREQAERVQDVPPTRQRDLDARTADTGKVLDDSGVIGDERNRSALRDARGAANDRTTARGVGQGGRGEFRSGELL